MPLFKKSQDVSYHEAGHVVASKLFDEILKIDYVTCDKATSRLKDPKSLGGMSAKLRIPVANLTVDDKDKIILIMLAGICSDNIYKSSESLKSSYYTNDTIHELFEAPEYEGDRDYALTWLSSLNGLIKPSNAEYLKKSFVLLHDVFQDRSVWECVTMVAEQMQLKKTLYESDIIDIISKSNLSDYIEKSKPKLLKNRGRFLGTTQMKKPWWKFW